MAHRLIITEHADELLDNIVYHLLYRLKNEQAAKHLLDGIENVYDCLEENPPHKLFLKLQIPPKIKQQPVEMSENLMQKPKLSNNQTKLQIFYIYKKKQQVYSINRNQSETFGKEITNV